MPTLTLTISDLALAGFQQDADRRNARNGDTALTATDMAQLAFNRIAQRAEDQAKTNNTQELLAKLELASPELIKQLKDIKLPEKPVETRPNRGNRPNRDENSGPAPLPTTEPTKDNPGKSK